MRDLAQIVSTPEKEICSIPKEEVLLFIKTLRDSEPLLTLNLLKFCTFKK